MACDWNLLPSFLPSLISAISGLAGVGLGGWMTNRRDALKERSRSSVEASYLAVLVIAHLERFANGCAEVSYDDGTCEGRPAGGGGDYCQVTTQPPTFDPLTLDVDWKALPPDLMYDVLIIPLRAEQLANYVAGKWAFADPPDYSDFFWARQHGYSVLGLEVLEVARRLREHANLPSQRPIEGGQNLHDILNEQKQTLERLHAEYQARISACPPPVCHPEVRQ